MYGPAPAPGPSPLICREDDGTFRRFRAAWRRRLLLHGPVGSSKSTIARLLKKGLEVYSRTDEGMVFAYSWKGPEGVWQKCPMHEEPLHLVPLDLRASFLARYKEINKGQHYQVHIKG